MDSLVTGIQRASGLMVVTPRQVATLARKSKRAWLAAALSAACLTAAMAQNPQPDPRAERSEERAGFERTRRIPSMDIEALAGSADAVARGHALRELSARFDEHRGWLDAALAARGSALARAVIYQALQHRYDGAVPFFPSRRTRWLSQDALTAMILDAVEMSDAPLSALAKGTLIALKDERVPDLLKETIDRLGRGGGALDEERARMVASCTAVVAIDVISTWAYVGTHVSPMPPGATPLALAEEGVRVVRTGRDFEANLAMHHKVELARLPYTEALIMAELAQTEGITQTVRTKANRIAAKKFGAFLDYLKAQPEPARYRFPGHLALATRYPALPTREVLNAARGTTVNPVEGCR
jgi:hypothetical protein